MALLTNAIDGSQAISHRFPFMTLLVKPPLSVRSPLLMTVLRQCLVQMAAIYGLPGDDEFVLDHEVIAEFHSDLHSCITALGMTELVRRDLSDDIALLFIGCEGSLNELLTFNQLQEV